MKNLSALIILLFSLIHLYGQPAMNISEPLSVSGNATEYGKHLPRIHLMADSTVVIFWSKAGSNPGLFMSKLEGEAFGPVIEIPTGNLQPDIWSGGLGPSFAVAGNAVFVAFEKWGDAIYCVRSTDGGLTFDDPVTAFIPPAGRAATLPAITTDGDGNPIIGCITTNLAEQEAQYEVVKSPDGGLTFGPAVIASLAADGDEVCECCPSNLLVTGSGDLYATFRNNNSNIRDIWISRSADGGSTFAQAVDIDETNWSIMGCPSTGPHTLDAGDHLMSVFFSAGQNWEQGVYLSILDKMSFESSETIKLPFIDGISGTQNFPRIAGNADTLGFVWHENTGSFYNVGFAWSLNGVDNIVEQAIQINGAANPQVYPDILFAGGKFHVVYEDQATATPVYQSIAFNTSTATSEQKTGQRELTVWPNPASDRVRIELSERSSGDLAVEILDLFGNTVRKQTIHASSYSIDVRDLTGGLYFVRAAKNNQLWVARLMVR